MKLGSREIGYMTIVLAIVLSLLLFSFNNSIKASASDACSCSVGSEPSCPHANNLPYQTYLGGLVVLGLLVVGGFSIWSSKQQAGASHAKRRKIKNLPEDEKKVYKEVESAHGAILQSELVEKTKLSKVKVSRLLDKLEGRGLIEKRRRGMTNLVILK